MQYITKHDPKKKGECDTCYYSWIKFLVPWNPISVYNLLERRSEIIHLKVRGCDGINRRISEL